MGKTGGPRESAAPFFVAQAEFPWLLDAGGLRESDAPPGREDRYLPHGYHGHEYAAPGAPGGRSVERRDSALRERAGTGRADLILTAPPRMRAGASALAALLEDRREER